MKKFLIILTDIALACYLLLAVTAFNRPDETSNVCSEVNIHVEDGVVRGFLDADEVKALLQKAKVYPLGTLMSKVNVRKIEETLKANPFIEAAQCYATQSGHVHITVAQRLPVIRVKADNGEDYYVDADGTIMPNTHFVSDLPIATGPIRQDYARKVLTSIGRYLAQQPLWNNQIEQVNVLPDGMIEMVPRVGDHVVYLGRPTRLEHKLARLEKFYKYGLSKAGWNKYSYINVEFDNQIICKKRS